MQETASKVNEQTFLDRWRIDPILLLALFVALAFCLCGIRWGRVEDWNPDQMALRRMSLTLKPHGYEKPPFHTFVNHLLVLWPLSLAEGAVQLITARPQNFAELEILGSRLLTAAMFLGMIFIGYRLADEFCGRTAARIIAFIFATSAGFVAQAHFLTVDIPVCFWMMLALFFASRIILDPQSKNYFAAGLCTGLATATKYNGLAVGVAIVVAHLLSQPWNWRALIPDKRLWIGLAMVVVGFLLGNPWAIFDWRRFSADFAYNYAVAPRYNGQTGLGFGKFARGIFDLLGWPGGILIGALIIISLLLLVRRKIDRRATQCFLLCASVFVLYTLKIGSFPRVPTRFVLPAVPFFILLAAPALRRSRFILPLLLPILFYNAVCSLYVGKWFRDDPRTVAQAWMEASVAAGSRIESSSSAPHWAKLPRLNAFETDADDPKFDKAGAHKIIDLRMPRPNSRFELFSSIFAGDEGMVEAARNRETPPDLQQFSGDSLEMRHPDFVAVSATDHMARIEGVHQYYEQMLRGEFPYRIVLDGTSTKLPWWTYPREMDQPIRRLTILQRADTSTTR